MSNRDQEARKQEILRLQNQVIREMAQSNLKNIGEDLWGLREDIDSLPQLTPPDISETPAPPAGDAPEVPELELPDMPPPPDFNRLKDLINASLPPMPAWRLPAKPELTLPDASGKPQGDDAAELTPPPGFPEVPVIDFEKPPAKAEATQQAQPAPEAPEAAEKEDMETLLAELNSLIGLDLIKKEVEGLVNLVKVNRLRQAHGLKVEDLSLHMVFSGNPGTGKTMIARLMSRIYHSLGILSKGHLVEVDRSGLVAGYVGQTALKTAEVVKSALGGVLFIDEAYALTTRGPQDYGQEAVETLLKAMEDHRDDLVVIVAGYVDLMNDFVHANPGLESRFNRFMYFPDYTVDEMVGIFHLRCDKAGYRLAVGAEETLRRIIREESEDNIGFGNARGVRNLFEQAVSRQANRLARQDTVTRDELMDITAGDLEDAQGDVREEAGEPQVDVASEVPEMPLVARGKTEETRAEP